MNKIYGDIEKSKLEFKILSQLNAFSIFKTEGLDRVKEMFPNEMDFVLSNGQKEYEEVKNVLINQLKKID